MGWLNSVCNVNCEEFRSIDEPFTHMQMMVVLMKERLYFTHDVGLKCISTLFCDFVTNWHRIDAPFDVYLFFNKALTVILLSANIFVSVSSFCHKDQLIWYCEIHRLGEPCYSLLYHQWFTNIHKTLRNSTKPGKYPWYSKN